MPESRQELQRRLHEVAFRQAGFFTAAQAARCKGTNVRRRRLYPQDLLSFEVTLPDLPTQRRIADRLGRVQSGTTRIARAFHSQQQQLRALSEDIHPWVGAPTKVAEILTLERFPVALNSARAYSCIGVRSFGMGLIRYAAVPPDELSKLRYFHLRPGRLVVSNIKAWEGAVAVSEDIDADRIASSRFLQYRSKSPSVSLEYVRDYLLSKRGIKALSDRSPGSADRNRTLSIAGFSEAEIPLPARDIQDAAVARRKRLVDARDLIARRGALAEALLDWARNAEFAALLTS